MIQVTIIIPLKIAIRNLYLILLSYFGFFNLLKSISFSQKMGLDFDLTDFMIIVKDLVHEHSLYSTT